LADSPHALLKAGEWRRRLLHAVSGLLVFETLTGLSILLLPFSVPNQMMVLLHTVAGIAFVLPYLWYQLRHWRHYRSLRLSHVVLTGYFAMVASLVLVVSGLVLTAQALFATRIGRAWDLAHIVATFALVLAVVPHIATLVVRAVRAPAAGEALLPATARYGRNTGLVTAGLFAVIVALVLLYRPPTLVNRFADDYSYPFGKDRPFAPSLASTTTGGAFDSRSLSGSKSCGTSGCHQEIYDEWSVSAHRYSAMDPAFQKVQTVMAEQNGAESTRYCGGCHDPISLFSGTKNIFAKDLTNLAGFQEGVSCVSCHSIKKTDIKGNANYQMAQPSRYLFELEDRDRTRWMRDFLIRSYPQYHVESLQHKLFKRPEFCAACHKQFIDEEINKVGWVQLQNQFDAWRKSRWNEPGDPTKTIECRECHMPLQESTDPGSGDDLDYNRSPKDKKHRSHRFLGANQFIPTVLKLPGAERHVALTGEWLRGEIDIPEIADKWRRGPAVPIALVVPDHVRPGEPVAIQARLTNTKVGHDFPTGPLDIIQAWVEISVTDQLGNVVFQSGRRDDRHFIVPGSFMFKAEPVDQYGNLIDRHNLWEMVGVRYRRSIFPGLSDQAEYSFLCPTTAAAAAPPPIGNGSRLDRVVTVPAAPERVTTLHVEARLMYRKADQFLLNFLFGEASGLTATVTVVSEDRKTIRVGPAE
jgi:hypothetical protein